MKKRINIVIFILVFVCASVILPYKAAGSRYNDQQQVLISEKSIKSENEIIKIDIKIPVISGLKDKTAEEKINDVFLKDALRFKTAREKEAVDAYEALKMNKLLYNKFEAAATYTVKYNKNNLLSIPVVYYQYTGGVHGLCTQAGYNFDLNTGRLLYLSDLFPKESDYKKVIDEAVLDQMKAQKNIYFGEAISLFKGIDEMHPYYIDGENLVITFSQYEIAPFAAGIREFKIPYSKLRLKFVKNIDLK